MTSNVLTEEQYRQEYDFLTAVLDTAGALIVVLDRSGRILRFNRMCEEMTGYASAEVLGTCIWDVLLLSEEVDSVKHVFGQLSAGMFPLRFENYWVARDGTRRLIDWSNTALLDDSGRVDYVIGTGIDVTERKQAEALVRELTATLEARVEERTAELAEEHQMLQTLMQASPLAIVGLNTEGRVDSWNAMAETLFGWIADEVLGQIPPYVTDPNTRQEFDELLQHVLAGGTIYGDEVIRETQHGITLSLRAFAAPRRNAEGMIQGVTVLFEDVTDRHRMEQAIEASESLWSAYTDSVGRTRFPIA